MVRVKGIQEASIAEELGIVPGTELLTVNGRELADFLDWEFLTADEELVIEARQPDGESIVFEIERPDGDVLEESFRYLWALGDAVLSVALVPVGLTQFSHLYTGKSMDLENAETLLRAVDRWADRARAERRDAWVYGSDELYLLAGRALP